jgi:hypothetical protein
MHNLTLTSRNLEKAKDNPLNSHCRKALQKAGQPIFPGTLGAPELMEWVLAQKDLPLDEEARFQLGNMVDLIKDKPTMSLTLLEASQSSSEGPLMDELLAETDPVTLGLKLLQKLKSQADNLTTSRDE